MDRRSRRGTPVNPRIRSVAKRRRRKQSAFILFAAAVLAVMVCASTYLVIEDLPLPVQGSNLPAAQIFPTATLPPPTPIPTVAELQILDPILPEPTATLDAPATESPPILYYTQAGDTLHTLAIRFNVQVSQITSPEPLPPESQFLPPNQLLLIPSAVENSTPNRQVIPDSEVVYSPSALDFDIASYVKEAGGYLSTYKQYINGAGRTMNGAEIVQQIARDNSINPRLLLALLDYQANWVSGQPRSLAETEYPMGYIDYHQRDLYRQLSWAVSQLSLGYYGWRAGIATSLTFPDGSTARLAPDLNAGTVGVMYLFSRLYNQREWAGVIFDPQSMPNHYTAMFGNPWIRAKTVEPLFPHTLVQPILILPFVKGQLWSYTGGPHSAWGTDGALAALDFAPASDTSGCAVSEKWAVAASSGLVVRSDQGAVVVDLDGDGEEQTGWNLLYMHIAKEGRVPVGTYVATGDYIGHPSCEGGVSTGTHIHIARKYNGEWILADGPLPFTLSGYQAHAGDAPYLGTLTRGAETIHACTCSDYLSNIRRPEDDLP